MPGYETTKIDDNRLRNSDNTVVLVLNESASTNLHTYYNSVIDIILSGAKLICISVGKESKIRKAIMMVMASYRDYNIYKVGSSDIIDEEYIKAVENRNPDLAEVQQYIGGDISAYSELNTILFGINNLVNTGDIDGLKVFIENHIESIESSIEVIEYLKKLADSTNSGDLADLIESLKNKVAASSRQIDDLNADLKQYKGENEKLNDKVNSLTMDVNRANRKVSDLEDQLKSAGGSAVISTYSDVDTRIIKCKTQSIIYFKEISYSKYTNSLVMNLYSILKNRPNKRVKLMIYDSKVGMPGLYKGMSILNTTEYLSNKAKIIRDTTKFVVSEPNRVFLEDVLTSINPQFDIVIVYDRLRQAPDLVTGNNVTKIFVVNSLSNFESVKESIRIPPNSLVISNDDRIQGAIRIGDIPDYHTATDSAKMTRYSKLTISENSNDRIIATIFTKARID